jgi:ribA/ribD-fused uncharacterized protein
MPTIYFYGYEGPYGYMSNFYPKWFRWRRFEWPDIEHAFQYAKTTNPTEQQNIRTALTPSIAKRLGRVCTLREDWENIKDILMYELVLAKFSQNESIADSLLSTGDSLIVENAKHDEYWGIGRGNGRNQMGKTLMAVRSHLASLGETDD